MSVRLFISHSLPAPRRLPFSAAALRALVKRVLVAEGISAGEWTLLLMDDAAMADLHGRTMNLPTTTDVLTFDLRQPDQPEPLHLDTAICVDEAHRQAAERGIPVLHEVLLYAVHSLLHVRGFNDVTPAQARRMHRREDRILIGLGVGPIYFSARPPRKRKPGDKRKKGAPSGARRGLHKKVSA